MQLTILRDKSNATVHYDWDTIFSQLLVTECIAICTGSQCDGRVPQRKVHLVEAMDVNGSVNDRENDYEVNTLNSQLAVSYSKSLRNKKKLC